MARPEFAATDRMRKKVRSLAIQGVPQEVIAGVIECDPKTLRKHFRQELDRGMAEANAKVVGALYRSAMRGSVAAQIFWVKTRMRWREPEAPPDAGPGIEGQPQYVVILPDNGRHRKPTEECESAKEISDGNIDNACRDIQSKGLMPESKGLGSYRAKLLRTSAYNSTLRPANLKDSAHFYADHHTMMNSLFSLRASYPDRLTR